MISTDVAMLTDAEMYDLIVEVVGDETSLEFCTLTSHYIDNNDIDTAIRANGTNWSDIKPLMDEVEERAEEMREEKREANEDADENTSTEGSDQEGGRWDARLVESDLRKQADRQWGRDAQINKAAEELSEAAAALNRALNGQQDKDELLTELLDARIMLWQMELMWLEEDLEDRLDDLLDDLDERLEVNHGE